jgi:hypothetical protein
MVVVAPQQNRQGFVDTGTLNLATVLGAPPVAGTRYIGTAILAAADRDDPTLILSQLALLIDGRTVWGPTDMPCGQTDRNGTPVVPTFGWGYSGAGATTCEMTFTPSRRVSIGLDLSTQPMVR